jgi:spermidine synthase
MQPPSAVHSRRRRLILLASIFVVGACGLIYELAAGAVASYLMGDSVTQYSLVIGTFLAAMGLGSWLTQWVRGDLLAAFIRVQLLVGVVGGYSALAVFAAFAHWDDVTWVVLGLACAVGTLVGMEIPFVLRLLRREAALRVTVAEVLSADYIGALAASIAFPFVVLPLLGLVRASLSFGTLNVLIASLGTALFWRELPGRRRLASWNALAWALVAVGLLLADRATTWLEDRLYQDEIVLAETTPYQRIVITRWRDDYRLHLNGHLQFSSRDEYRYHEALVLPALGVAMHGPELESLAESLRVLVLGGGDGLAIRQMLPLRNIARIDLVDIDRRMVELFRERAALASLNDGAFSDRRVLAHYEDAMAYLRNSDGKYDAIIMDLPDPSSVETNKLYTAEFFGLALRRLTDRGVLVTQASSPFYARRTFWCIVHTLQAAVERSDAVRAGGRGARKLVPYHVHVPSFGDWGFVMAAPTALLEDGFALAGEGCFLTQDVFARARVFPPDTAEVATGVNSLLRPLLTHYHANDWSRWGE